MSETIYRRRMQRHGGSRAQNLHPVETQNLDERPWAWEPCPVAHEHFPNPHNYTVRVRDVAHTCRSAAHRGPYAQFFCKHPPQVSCSCRVLGNDTADYVGEHWDPDRFYMHDDLQVPGSQALKRQKTTQSAFGGNPYKV
jgi:hypothetical protein